MDPHTGIGLTDHSVVNLIAPNGITSDSLTKVVAVLGPREGLKFIEATPEVTAQVMRESGGKIEVSSSRGFARYFEKN